MQHYWTAHPPAAAPVILDIDSPPSPGDRYAALKAAFNVAKGVVSTTGGEAAMLAAYHSTLVPPFCLSAVKSFFDGQ
jgi:hypothetical protein